MASVEDQVKSIIADQLGVKIEQLANSAILVDDLGADSLDSVELIMTLGDQFGIDDIPDEDAAAIDTVQNAIDYVQSHI